MDFRTLYLLCVVCSISNLGNIFKGESILGDSVGGVKKVC